MSRPLDCAAAPCGSCPYRRDTPTGVWHPEEYEKLRHYTGSLDGIPALGIFLCHQTNATGRETVCRGWLTVERDSVAVRLALLRGTVTPEQVKRSVSTEIYTTGAEAADAGMRGVRAPNAKARRMMERLIRKGAGRAPGDAARPQGGER